VPRRSAGLLLHRTTAGGREVLLGHPGGPFWARKDDGAWSIPKGEYADGEDPWTVAQREFTEETGSPPPTGEPVALPAVRQAGGKVVTAFAVEGDVDPAGAVSNTVTLEWPRGSGVVREFPEIDRLEWFDVATARRKLVAGQVPLLDHLETALAGS
jgi:predicted NUDIX family NTP pyrophosphohydrolase